MGTVYFGDKKVSLTNISKSLTVSTAQTNSSAGGTFSVTLPSSVITLDYGCFKGCSALTSVTIPSSVTSLGNGCFSGCSSLSSITIPSSITSLSDYCFSGCSSLPSVTIPSSVTSLGNGCFSGCSSLSSITIPSSITSLSDYCFQYCSALTSVTIPSSVTSLGTGCFSDCYLLSYVIIPASVTSIGSECFYMINGSNNRHLYFKGNPPIFAAGLGFLNNPKTYVSSPAFSDCIFKLSAFGLTTDDIVVTDGVTDLSGRGNNATAATGVTVVNDTILGSCFSSDGTSSKNITTSALSTLFKGINGATFFFQIKMNQLTSYNCVYACDYNGTAAFACRISSSGQVAFGGKRTSSETSTTYKTYNAGLKANTVYDLAVVYDFSSANIKLYLDGNLVSSQAYLTAGTFMTESLSVLSILKQGSSGFNGVLSDFRIFARALNATEISKLHIGAQWTSSVKEPILSYYSNPIRLLTWVSVPPDPVLVLDALTSTTGTGGVKDISGNGYHGTITGTGISISQDNSLGACFDCQGVNGSYILVQNTVLDNKRTFTLHFKWKASEPSSNDWVFVASGNGKSSTRQISVSAGSLQISFGIYDTTTSTNTGTCIYDQHPFDGVIHTFTYTVDFDNSIAILYVDGIKFTEASATVSSGYAITSQHYTFGNAWTSFKNAPHKGKLKDIRIYDRVLTPAEVEALHDNS